MNRDKSTKMLHYAGAMFLGILSLVVIIASYFFIAKARGWDQQNTISVEASAEKKATPDIATFSFLVKEKAKNPKDAQKMVSKKVASILDGLKKLGVEEKDMSTESYQIYPHYEWVRVKEEAKTSPEGIVYYPGNGNKRVLTGYEVSQRVNLAVRNFDIIPEVLGLFAENGVENLNGPNFRVEDPEKIKEEVKLEAIKKAKEKAKRLANELGVKLGRIVSFHEGGNTYPTIQRAYPMAMKALVEEDASPELPVGEDTIQSSVTITYTIK